MTRDVDADDRAVTRDGEAVKEVVPPVGASSPDQAGGNGNGNGNGHAGDPPHDAVGAYVLDALPTDEREAFEAHLATCLACRQEVAELSPVVLVLPRLLEIEPLPEIASGEHVTGLVSARPSLSLRDRILTAAREDEPSESSEPDTEASESVPPTAVTEPEEPADLKVEEDAALPPPTPFSARPPRRIRPGVAGSAAEASTSPWQAVVRMDRGWLVAAALAIVAIGAVLWSLALQGQVDDLRTENSAQDQEIARLRIPTNAVATLLAPTEDGPDSAAGALYYSLDPDQAAVLFVEGMEPLPADRVYQLWYLNADDPTPVPGPIFTVDESGSGTVSVSTDVPLFDAVALTAEPEGGRDTPTLPVLMQGQLGGARG